MWLFDVSGFPPRWYCGNWSYQLGWLFIASQLIIFISYITIPAIISYYISKRKDINFPVILWLFVAFILFCGIGHLFDAVAFWYPWYRFLAFWHFLTGLVSLVTASTMIFLVPKLLAIPERNLALESQLTARNKELLEVNDELQRFAYVASHDLQTPTRTISLNTELLYRRSDGLEEKDRKRVQRVWKSAQRLAKLIDDLLAFSRVDTRYEGKKDVRLDVVFEEVYQDICEIGYSVKKVGSLGILECDKGQITLLFQNLVINGLKYNESEKPSVEVSREEGKEYVRLVFSDDGIGIEEKYWNKIFEPFRRLHTYDEYEGSGIGLSVCKRVMNKHGGKIYVRKSSQDGTVIIAEFPK